MKLEASKNNIVLRPIKADSKTKGGIHMPNQFREKFEDGAVIVSVGPLVEDLAVGNIVVRPDPPRYEIVDDNTNEVFWLAEENDILAKIV